MKRQLNIPAQYGAVVNALPIMMAVSAVLMDVAGETEHETLTAPCRYEFFW
jgi:hypothetical protein